MGRPVDTRVRLRPKNPNYVYGPVNGPMNILRQTDGVLFIFTPQINISRQVDYDSTSPVHSNYEFHTFTRSRAPNITLTGTFNVQTSQEADYLRAVLIFLSVVTKMEFGTKGLSSFFSDPLADAVQNANVGETFFTSSQNDLAGLPPPVLLLDGYGSYMFDRVPVIVTTVSYDLSQDSHLIFTSDFQTKVPNEMLISIGLSMQPTPRKVRDEFSLDDIKSGAIIRKGGWI